MGQVKIKQMDTPFGGRTFISYSKPRDQGQLAVGGPGRPHEVKL